MLESIEDNHEHFSVQIEAVLKWISSASGLLSSIGIALHHPRKEQRISKNEAKSYLQVCSAEVKSQTPVVTKLLNHLSENFQDPRKVESDERFFYDNRDEFDIGEESRARSYFVNNGNDIFPTKAKVSSYISDECRNNLETIRDLLIVKKYWDQLRVQIKVLFFQLRANGEISKTRSSEAAACNLKSDLELFKKIYEEIRGSDSCEGTDMEFSQKDEGYFSTLERTAQDGSIHDRSSSLENVTAAQISLERRLESLAMDTDPKEVLFDDRSAYSFLSPNPKYSGFDSYEWDAIFRIVERFSDNTTALLSWIDELKEIGLDNASPSCPFYSFETPKRSTARRHINRLYVDVIDDAATLLRNLPSEKSILLTVLQNIDSRCRRCGIVVGDDFAKLASIEPSVDRIHPKSHFLSEKLRNSLSFAFPLPQYEELNPLPLRKLSPTCCYDLYPKDSSTPQSRNEQLCQALTPLSASDYEFESDCRLLQRPRRVNDRTRQLNVFGFNYSTRWQYDNFLYEHEAFCEWLETMEQLLNKAETCTLSGFEKEMQLWKCLRELTANEAMRDRLNVEANEISNTYPELQQSVQSMMADLNNLWDALHERITCAFPLWSSKFMLYEPFRDYPRYFGIGDKFLYPSSVDSYSWKKVNSLPCYEPLIDDLTDRVTSSPKYCDSLFSSEVADEPCNFGSFKQPIIWKKFEGIESEINRNVFPNKIERPCFPNSKLRTTLDKNAKDIKKDDDIILSDSDATISEPFLLSEIIMDPFELSGYIKDFHQLLKLIEAEVFLLNSSEPIGWDPLRVEQLLRKNEERKLKLKEENRKLRQIMMASEKVMKNHDQKVSEFFLLWSSSMLEQRYLNLTLYTIDMECILERRSEIIAKGTTGKHLSHFIEGAWSDRGEDLRPSVHTEDKDYEIFWLVF